MHPILNTTRGQKFDTVKHQIESAIERFALPLALYGSLATLPQVIQVVFFRQTAGVSIWTFGLFLLGNLFWYSYGHIRQDKPIMVSHLTTGLLNMAIIAGVLIS
jgi:uncharacterized protein with PQ loop repeat